MAVFPSFDCQNDSPLALLHENRLRVLAFEPDASRVSKARTSSAAGNRGMIILTMLRPSLPMQLESDSSYLVLFLDREIVKQLNLSFRCRE